MRTALRSLLVAATTAGALALPVPAEAATIITLTCDTSGDHGLTCTVDGTAVDPYYVRWYRDGAYGSIWDDKKTITMFCRVAPEEIEVRVVLGDANGEDEMTTWGICGTA